VLFILLTVDKLVVDATAGAFLTLGLIWGTWFEPRCAARAEAANLAFLAASVDSGEESD
jgi:hypothetical protein